MSARVLVGAFAIAAIAVFSSAPPVLAAKSQQTIATPTGSAKVTSLQRIQMMVRGLDARGRGERRPAPLDPAARRSRDAGAAEERLGHRLRRAGHGLWIRPRGPAAG